MKFFASLAGLIVASSALSSLAPDAHACSPPAPGLVASLPKNGDTYPANAALLFYGYDIALDALTVKVDGQPATFVDAPDIASFGLGALVARISPEPEPGQTVEIAGSFCPEVACEPSAITFTAGELDNAPPGSPTAISFDIHDHADFVSSGGDCQSDTDLTWYVRVDTVVGAGPSESAVILHVQAFRDASFEDLLFSESQLMTGASGTISRGTTVSVLGDTAPEALCFRALVRDLSGNVSIPTVEVCKPCRYRKDDAGGNDSHPPEPTWTSADVYPGGPCDEGGNGGGGNGGNAGGGDGGGGDAGGGGEAGGGDAGGGNGDDVSVVGCSCRLPAGDTSGSTAALLALLAGTAAGRRRRRDSKS